VCKISAEVKALRYRATKSVVFVASLSDMPVQTPLFGRETRRYVGRDGAFENVL
jgi:hypothetical protein